MYVKMHSEHNMKSLTDIFWLYRELPEEILNIT
jgi:hypothetical protein